MATDPFDEVLDLEDQFFREGYKKGHEDGVKAGRTEGRALGLENGFQKFLEAGRLQGRAIVWGSRLHTNQSSDEVSTSPGEASASGQRRQRLRGLSSSAKLQKNITALYSLVESDTLSTENSDEAVADFDDRLRRAQGKARVVAKAVGESTEPFQSRDLASNSGRANGSVEDTAPQQAYGANAA
jgi:hypothetical protein